MSSLAPLSLSELDPERMQQLAATPDSTWEQLSLTQVFESVDVIPLSNPKKENHLRFVAVSDTHKKMGELKLPEGDVILHCGDFSNLGRPREVFDFAREFAATKFKHRVVIAGNHEISFQNKDGWYQSNWREFHDEFHDADSIRDLLIKNPAITYLEDSSVTIEGIKIYGAPWSAYFHNWAFNLPPQRMNMGKIAKIWGKIPSDTDILLTHGPPLGRGDLCTSGYRAGCLELLRQVQTRVKPKYHLFGHIHEAYGSSSDGTTVFANVASCNKRRLPVNAPIVFDLPIPQKK